MSGMYEMVRAERHALAAYLDTLRPEQWSAATWCEKWNVQQVVAHLTAAGHVTFPHFAAGFLRAGFDFDRFVERDLQRYADGTPAQTRDEFGAILDSRRTPPGPAYVALGEIMVHGEDIRRALGAVGQHDDEHLLTLVEQYRTTGPPLRAKSRIRGLRLRATDVDWSSGDGPEVEGPAMSLILAMVGRDGALDDCRGEGVDTLRSRARTAA